MATKDTKRARAEEARRRSEENLARELRRSRIQNAVVIGLVVLGIAGFTAAAIWIANSGDDQRAAADLELYDSGELTTPTIVDDIGGVYVTADGAAAPAPTSTDKVRVDVYFDPLCPVCQGFEAINGADISALREEGVIDHYVHPISILDRLSAGSDYPTRAVNAIYTVAEYAPEHFEEFYVGLFINQPAENTVGLTNSQIDEIAASAGVPQDVIDRIEDGEFTQYVAYATEQSSIRGVRGTPTIVLDGTQYSGAWNQPGQLRFDIEQLAGVTEEGAAA